MRASVLIACRNGERHLSETLRALGAQRWDEPWEVIFADNGSTDASAAIFRRFAADHPWIATRYVDASHGVGKPHALNLGVALAASPAIILLDADDVPAAGWLKAMATALQSHDFVSARREIALLNTGETGRYIFNDDIGDLYFKPFPPYAPCISGSACGFTRTLFDAVGPFDPASPPCEDTDFSIRAHLAGFAAHVAEGAVIHYRLRDDLGAITRQAFTTSRQEVSVARKFRGTGPSPRDTWRQLVRLTYKVSRAYWAVRRRPESFPADYVAKVHFRMGVVRGQWSGVVTYRARPSIGLLPERSASAP